MEVKRVGLNILYVAYAQENESIGNTHINNFIFFHLKMLQNLSLVWQIVHLLTVEGV